MLAIRFARIGKTKQPTFRLTVAEKGRDTFSRALEILGHYNPRSKVCEVNAERIKYWLSVGAKPSDRVHNLLVDQNVMAGPKVKVSRGKKKAVEEGKTATPTATGEAKNQAPTPEAKASA